jgi:TRAP-type C4-dicarboxylate transport system permease small subunit
MLPRASSRFSPSERAGAAVIDRLSSAYGRLLAGLALAGCVILFAMMLIIVLDVALRNLAVPGLPRGLAWSNEVSELMLYLITLCVAPWLLRQGQHIRVDIVLRAIPPRLAWFLEWLGDAIALACCLVFAWFGAQAAWSSYASGAVNIKTLVTPEWWALAPLPAVFVLLALEMVFRLVRLYHAERGPRADAVSAG